MGQILDTINKKVALPFQTTSSTADLSSNPLINVCNGDLITQQTDVIVVCLSSKFLFDTICDGGGKPFKNSYEKAFKKDAKASVISVPAGGKLASKQVYFLQWTRSSDNARLRQSVEKFVSNAMEKAMEDNYRSIAFPAIGCGKSGCPISLIAQTMVKEVHRQSSTNSINVSFVIQPERADIYDEFQKQLTLLLSPQQLSRVSSTGRTTVGRGMIDVEKGDITTQKVDVIIGSSSSSVLMRAIIKAAGDEVETAYKLECQNNPNSILISIVPGALPCKRIFFLKWKPAVDEGILRQSLVDLVWTVIQHTISYQFTSIAFPSIGCGQHGCAADVVVKTIVTEMKHQLTMRDYHLKVIFVVHPSQQNIYDEFRKQLSITENVDVTESSKYTLPSTWQKSTKNDMRFVVPSRTDEYKSILNNFNKKIKGNCTQIIRIERIQNERWYMQYLAHSRDFEKRLKKDTEKHLYHGCPEQAANSIMQDCFNRSFAGVNGTAYGVGVYFSSDANYSHRYAIPNTNGERRIFVARVLIGKTTKGDTSMKTRPEGFDSTTDGQHIFVTYHDAQAYADYLIIYK